MNGSVHADLVGPAGRRLELRLTDCTDISGGTVDTLVFTIRGLPQIATVPCPWGLSSRLVVFLIWARPPLRRHGRWSCPSHQIAFPAPQDAVPS